MAGYNPWEQQQGLVLLVQWVQEAIALTEKQAVI